MSAKIKFLRLKIMCLQVSYMKKIWKNNYFASLNHWRKESAPESDPEPDPDPLVGGTDPNPDPHQNITDPQRCFPVVRIGTPHPQASVSPLPLVPGGADTLAYGRGDGGFQFGRGTLNIKYMYFLSPHHTSSAENILPVQCTRKNLIIPLTIIN